MPGFFMSLLNRNFNLSQRMSQELGRQIVCGFYDRKESLPTEADLCEQFGVSRSAVREAVKMLSAKGLIASKPRQGIRIQPEEQWNIFDTDLLRWSLESNPSMAVLKEFLEMRLAIEPEAASLAAKHAATENIEAIEAALECMRNPDMSAEAQLEADIEFHVSILYATNNRFYIRLRDFIQTALRVSIRHTHPMKDNYDEVVQDHANIFNAIKDREQALARQAMSGLVNDALNFIESELRKREMLEPKITGS
jgi:DNA-binding FadR family transcriptional regulator